jgi:hypothetical protein
MSHLKPYNQIEEGEYWGDPGPETRELHDAFTNTDAGRDLYALGVRPIRERSRIKYERRGQNQSMPRTAAYKKSDGKFHIEHYSSKPGLEVYGEKDFDTAEELFRHLWMRIAKNLIPASLISKREAEKRINLEELFPIGHRSSQEGFFNVIKPLIGGEELEHASNQDLVQTETVQKLLSLGLVGKSDRYSSDQSKPIVVKDLSKNQIIKYKFYCNAAQTVKNMYADLITSIIGNRSFSECVGTLTSRYTDYEAWTVTNTNRLPLNSVNYRTGENTLKCNVQDNDMMAAVFLSIIKRTFKRAKGSNLDERMIAGSYSNSAIVEEINSLMSDYFFQAATDLDPSVFFEKDYHGDEQILKNGKALLIKYFLKNGSMDLKGMITSNPQLEELVTFATSHEDIDQMTKKLIQVSKLLKFI